MVAARACVVDIFTKIVQATSYHNFVFFCAPLYLTSVQAMDKFYRASTSGGSHSSRRDDDKRRRDEFDHVEDIVAKKKRELSNLKDEADRLQSDVDRLRRERDKAEAENDKHRAENDKLRAENDRLRAESDRKSAALDQLERELTKRFKIALDDAFEEVLGVPVTNERATATDPSEDPTLPAEDTPGEAAPAPPQSEAEEDKMQEDALEQAVHSRNEMPETQL